MSPVLNASPWISLPRRLERREAGARHVLDVDERAPRRAVALEPNRAGRDRPADEVVEHDVEPQPRRDAVGGGEAQQDRREVVGRQPASDRSARTFDTRRP